MHSNESLIQNFYEAFSRKDYRTMQDAYHPDATFSDPVFRDLSAAEVKSMWEMLITSSTDLVITFSDIKADHRQGECYWEARYTFTATGRKVHNVITAHFAFRDGLILRHEDHFNFWRWSRMALGIPGFVLGWSPYLLRKVQGKARRRLERFMGENGRE